MDRAFARHRIIYTSQYRAEVPYPFRLDLAAVWFSHIVVELIESSTICSVRDEEGTPAFEALWPAHNQTYNMDRIETPSRWASPQTGFPPK